MGIPDEFVTNFWTVFNSWLRGLIGFGGTQGTTPGLVTELWVTIIGMGVAFMILRAFRGMVVPYRPTTKLVMDGVDRPIWMEDTDAENWIRGLGYRNLGSKATTTNYARFNPETGAEEGQMKVTRYGND